VLYTVLQVMDDVCCSLLLDFGIHVTYPHSSCRNGWNTTVPHLTSLTSIIPSLPHSHPVLAISPRLAIYTAITSTYLLSFSFLYSPTTKHRRLNYNF
jgi:hypothetical protein